MPAMPGSDDQSQPTSANDMAGSGWSSHQILVIFKTEEKWGNDPPQASHACGQPGPGLSLDISLSSKVLSVQE